MILEEIGSHLVESVEDIKWPAAGVVGSLFLGKAPDSPTAVWVLYEYPGAPPVETLKDGAPSMTRPRISCRARASRYDVARQMAQDAWDVLAGMVGVVIEGVDITLEAQNDPHGLGTDDSGREWCGSDYQVWRE